MALIKCKKGHFYDNSKYESCPYCDIGAVTIGNQIQAENEHTIGYDVSLNNAQAAGSRVLSKDDRTIGYDELHEDERTVGIAFSGEGNPVTGWLVCTSGSERGRDYRLHEGRNFVGRALFSDVSVADTSIARENHFSVVYDGKNNEFIIVPGEGTLTYVDGHVLTQPQQITDDMCIQAGKSKFAFRSFCRKKVQWNEMDTDN